MASRWSVRVWPSGTVGLPAGTNTGAWLPVRRHIRGIDCQDERLGAGENGRSAVAVSVVCGRKRDREVAAVLEAWGEGKAARAVAVIDECSEGRQADDRKHQRITIGLDGLD